MNERRQSLRELASRAAKSSTGNAVPCANCGCEWTVRDGAILLCRLCHSPVSPATEPDRADIGGGIVEVIPRRHWQHRMAANEVFKVVIGGEVVGTVEIRERRLMVIDVPEYVELCPIET